MTKQELKINDIWRIVRELSQRDWTKNHEERIDKMERELNLVKGNHEELLKRHKALERFMKLEYEDNPKYQKYGK